METITTILIYIICGVGICFLGLIAYLYYKVIKFLIDTVKQVNESTK